MEDKITIGDATFYHGDCLEVMNQISDNSIDMIITDPPYSTPVITSFGRKKIKNLADLSIQQYYLKGLKIQFERILKPNGRLFIFCDDKYYPIIFAVFYGWLNTQIVVWDKGIIGMGRPFRKRHELIFYANREPYNHNKNLSHFPTVLNYAPIRKNKHHGAEKPINLIRDLILGFSNKKEIICDPFFGSGTTGIAACKNNRIFIGIEMSDKYFDIAIARYRNETRQLRICDLK